MQTPPDLLLVVGASGRAAAYSMLLAGYRPLAIDLFADADLLACCPVKLWDNCSESLLSLAREFPPGPWLYTGAIENRPELVNRLAAERPLLGNGAEVLSGVRNPRRLTTVLARRGFPTPRIAAAGEDHRAGSWLRKPLKSGGGTGIRRFRHESSGAGNLDGDYLQQFINGDSYSAVYVAATDRTVWLGTTKQLIGAAWTGARGFRYGGSVGPIRFPAAIQGQIRQLGTCLAEEFQLRGLFGVDFIVHADAVWPVEVNPRYTASVEILERATGIAAIAMHVAACQDKQLRQPAQLSTDGLHGKAIIYAKRGILVPPSLAKFVARRNTQPVWPEIADVPAAGSRIERGRPVATVFARASNCELVETKLRLRTLEIQRLVGC